MDTDSGDRASPDLPELLAAHPEVVARLLAQHVEDGTGRCAVCSAGPQAGRVGWPCRLHEIAAAAKARGHSR